MEKEKNIIIIIKFEGEFKNDIRWNGKGYDNKNNIVYELRNGKGYAKEYHNNGKLEFEGEFLNGQKNGKCKTYNYEGKLMFDGLYLNNKAIGEDQEYNIYGGLEFVGEYLYNHKLKGKYYIKGKLEYDGEFLLEWKRI